MTYTRIAPLRVLREHLVRIDKAAEFCNLDRRSFILNTVMAEVAEIEERRRQKRQRGRPSDLMRARDLHDAFESEPIASPGGTNLRDLLAPHETGATPPVPERAATDQSSQRLDGI